MSFSYPLPDVPDSSSPPSSPPQAGGSQEEERHFQTCLAYVQRHAAGPVEGLYTPASLAWRIYREPIVLLAATPAILLQMAHPAIATGVHTWSNFRHDLIGRARRTSNALYHLVFGDLQQAVRTGRRLYALHRSVQGLTESDNQARSAGKPYRATDPALLFWVQATLIDLSLQFYEHLVQPLTAPEREQFYQEACLMAPLLGVLPDRLPPALPDFYAYYHATLSSMDLDVGPVARVEVESLLGTRLLPRRLHHTLTAGFLPARFRTSYGLAWDRHEALRFERLLRILHTVYSALPSGLRAAPAYHQARYRIARARHQPTPATGYVYTGIRKLSPLPLSLEPYEPPATVERYKKV